QWSIFWTETDLRSAGDFSRIVAYWVAACASWVEFFLEVYFTPFLKVYWISMLGFLMCLCGEILRKLAMLHAGSGFTHRLALSKRPDHRLVTTGIYAYLRHPGYTGLFSFRFDGETPGGRAIREGPEL
ncbi:isoprenylcysteine carboxyl methyltransferase family protein, partial [Ancylostoma duodenale]